MWFQALKIYNRVDIRQLSPSKLFDIHIFYSSFSKANTKGAYTFDSDLFFSP